MKKQFIPINRIALESDTDLMVIPLRKFRRDNPDLEIDFSFCSDCDELVLKRTGDYFEVIFF